MDNNLLFAPKLNRLESAELFARVSLKLGCNYLACGGPISRLESQIFRASELMGFNASVLAMPTGIHICVEDPLTGKAVTRIARINEFSIDLNELRGLDRLLDKLGKGQVSLRLVLNLLKRNLYKKNLYSKKIIFTAQFMLGLSAGLLRYGEFFASIGSGLVTVLVFFLIGKLPLSNQSYRLFGDFISCLLALGISAIGALIFNLPLGALALGTLVAIVPGLTLTTGISELAEQNFLSGTIKLLKAGFTFLAMGISYLIALDLSSIIGIDASAVRSTLEVTAHNPVWVNYASVAILVVGASILFNAPRWSIPWAVIAGWAGWIVLANFTNPNLVVLAAFSASFALGLVSSLFGYYSRSPSQVVSVPGVLILVPGMLALSSFKTMSLTATGLNVAIGMGVHAVLIAVAIVFGLMSAKLILRMSG